MLMALESGQIAADVMARNLKGLRQGAGVATLGDDYRTAYRRNFDSRLRVSGLLRRAAFVPHLDEAAILFFGTSAYLRRRLARATRNRKARPSNV
jgi:hypothetical protein